MGSTEDMLTFIIYKNQEPAKFELKSDEILGYFKRLKTDEEEIKIGRLTRHGIGALFGSFGKYQEFVVVSTQTGFWSFEKQMDGIYIQYSDFERDVKNKINGNNRTTILPIIYYPRSNNSSKLKTIYEVISWIIETGSLYKPYNITESNCQIFSKELYRMLHSI